jgi:hypothetical protein
MKNLGILSVLLTTAATFERENPELSEFMNSPEETERFHTDFEKFLDDMEAKRKEEDKE